jgi:predicted anti-sigma-YlaC factor YlaD
MNCAELRDRFDAYVAGTLSDAESVAVESHLDTCIACHEVLANHDRPLGATAQLPRSVSPPTDLWPAIEQALASRRRLRGGVTLPGWLLAAAAVLVIAVSSAGTAMLLRHNLSARPAVRLSSFSALESQYSAASSESFALSTRRSPSRARLWPRIRATQRWANSWWRRGARR